jgi:DNA-binding transcriptional ArsR family regulator
MRYLLRVEAFAGLADPVRRAVLERLRSGPCRVVDLAGGFAISRPAVSRHLAVLRSAGLVHATSHGRENWYALDPSGISAAAGWLAALVSPPPVRAQDLDALDVEVRRTRREREPARARPTRPDPSSRRRTA